MSDSICVKYGHDFQLDLDGQVTCSMCGSMDDERDSSGSYNGRRAVSETDNEGPIPSPEAMTDDVLPRRTYNEPELNESGYGYDELKDFDEYKDNNKSNITPFLGPNR